MKSCYFAHSMRDYNSKEESRIRAILEKYFIVVCPSRDLPNMGSGMDPYIAIVKTCDVVIVMEHQGYVGKGVYVEIYAALKSNIPVYVIRNDNLMRVHGIEVENPTDWKIRHAKIEAEEKVTWQEANI